MSPLPCRVLLCKMSLLPYRVLSRLPRPQLSAACPKYSDEECVHPLAGPCTPGTAKNPVPALQGFVKSARASVECVNQACREVSESRRLQAVLRAVLATGNALNTGTPRANAEGIKLESLLKIADVKVRLWDLFR